MPNKTRAVVIGGGILLLSIIILAISWQNQDTFQPTRTPTPIYTSIVTETAPPTPSLTLSGFQILQTTEAELTDTAVTQIALNSTVTAQFISDITATASMQNFEATEISAFATLTALAATATPTIQLITYNLDQILSAYTNGQFGITWEQFKISPDGNYIDIYADGVYRTSDNTRLLTTYTNSSVVFSPNSAYIALGQDSVYRSSDGAYLFSINGSGSPIFSPNSAYLAVEEEGVYRISDGQLLFEIDEPYPTFSLDSQYIMVRNDGVYRLSDGERIFNLEVENRAEEAKSGIISPDSAYIAVHGDALYRLADGQRLFPIRESANSFSSDSRYVTVQSDGVYRLSDGQRLFAIESFYASFSPDSTYTAIDNDAVYRLSDGQRLFEISDGQTSFSPDGAYLIIDNDAVYRASDGERLFEIGGEAIEFSPDGDYVIVSNDGMYRLRDGQFYAGISEILLYQHGFLRISGVRIRIDPTLEQRDFYILRGNRNAILYSGEIDKEQVSELQFERILIGYRKNSMWYQIPFSGIPPLVWISSADVTVLQSSADF